jgi:hypothetical protein
VVQLTSNFNVILLGCYGFWTNDIQRDYLGVGSLANEELASEPCGWNNLK